MATKSYVVVQLRPDGSIRFRAWGNRWASEYGEARQYRLREATVAAEDHGAQVVEGYGLESERVVHDASIGKGV